jgi:predicted nucleic acid-binding protein
MRCLDASYLIDLVKGEPDAVAKARTLDEASEEVYIAAPALTEVLQGAYFKGGSTLRETLDILASATVLDIDARVADEAGRIGADLLRRGTTVATVDLLIAATAKVNGCVLVTRDAAFTRIPNLAVETY